jgi:type 1 glutamine amidotransferase
MLIDPGVRVLADTAYTYEGRVVTMPVAWTKHWGAGRVFYHSLGHDPEEFTRHPEARRLTVQGCLWAAGLL